MPKIKVLIVEDENIVALDLKRRLTKLGYDVVGMAADARRTMDIVREASPDIILMDIHIKGNKDGIETSQMVRKEYQTPVIFLTAYSEDSTLKRATTSMPYGYLLKPFSERELHAAIQVAIERNHFDNQLRKRDAHLQLALNAANLNTWELREDDDPVILGYGEEGKLSELQSWGELLASIVPEEREKVRLQVESLKSHAVQDIVVEFQIEAPGLKPRWFALFGKSYKQSRGEEYQTVGILQDISERRLIEENLKQAAMVYECSADGIVILDKDRKVISTNDAFTQITGFDQKSIVGEELSLLSSENLDDVETDELWEVLENQGVWQGEVKAFRQSHDMLFAWVKVGVVPDSVSSLGQYVVIVSDMTAMREVQEKLTEIAYYDGLTSLPNRNLFMDRLGIALAKAKREKHQLAVFFLDLDHFKRINDTFGHQVGDAMLRSVAQRLKSQLRLSDTLCRIGGDEFIIIIEKFKNLDDLEFLAGKLLGCLNKPLLLGNTEVIPSGSIGISIFPIDTVNKDDLIMMADTAMYSAKHLGRGRYAFYEPEMTTQTAHLLYREEELRHAIQNNEFILYYQPQYDARSGDIIGLEALIRWQHPKMGLVSAAEIIPIAETSDLIVDIGAWVMNEVCRQYKVWLQKSIAPLRVAVNVSPRQLVNTHFPAVVASSLEQHGVSPDSLELEITESCLQDNDTIIRCLRETEDMGVSISIDDFGTGYSCLSSLKSLPIHRLKIDQAFVRDIPDYETDCAIASAIIVLGQQLNMSITAEGIESKEQADFLRKAGCHELQGYYFSQPLPPSEIEELLLTKKFKQQTC